ncbi:hypothetical protein [Caballeronia zhejiangensis]|uniref:hypothetical protein n=1 Tax=Caballeronia zhejiangensis TaxID=871203 RepID=UPI00158CAA94|nr:hypothetical protein [Caballeronia zhejiangensis]
MKDYVTALAAVFLILGIDYLVALQWGWNVGNLAAALLAAPLGWLVIRRVRAKRRQ